MGTGMGWWLPSPQVTSPLLPLLLVAPQLFVVVACPCPPCPCPARVARWQVLRGVDLPNMEVVGKQDPYVKVSLLRVGTRPTPSVRAPRGAPAARAQRVHAQSSPYSPWWYGRPRDVLWKCACVYVHALVVRWLRGRVRAWALGRSRLPPICCPVGSQVSILPCVRM